MATIDARELMAFRLAMGEGREYENARHEAKRAGRSGIYRLKRDEVP